MSEDCKTCRILKATIAGLRRKNKGLGKRVATLEQMLKEGQNNRPKYRNKGRGPKR